MGDAGADRAVSGVAVESEDTSADSFAETSMLAFGLVCCSAAQLAPIIETMASAASKSLIRIFPPDYLCLYIGYHDQG